jgi:TRAP transporter 4TM/12TM fusion protein
MRALIADLVGPSHPRELTGRAAVTVRWFAIGIALYHIAALSIWYAPIGFHSVVHLTSVLALTFLMRSSHAHRRGGLTLEGAILAVLAVGTGILFLLQLDAFEQRLVVISPLTAGQTALALALLLLLFEGSRRVVGMPFVLLMLAFLMVIQFGPHLPGPWRHPGLDVAEMLDVLVWTPLDGIWGIPLRISATLIALFFVFGKLVQRSGLGNLLASLCVALAGRTRGGPARIAVLSSALVGSVTGGPATNMAITGSFTIPMMQRAGYKPYFAGGIEAAASTGASLVPPVMTGIVFIMAELTGTSLVRIMLMAIVPATLYYACLLLQVQLRAAKMNLAPSAERLDMAGARTLLWQRGHLLLPIFLVIGLLVAGVYPVAAVLWAILAVPASALLRRETRMSPGAILSALADASRDLIRVAPVCALSGIVIVALFQTGLGSTFSHFVSVAAGQSLLLLVLLGAGACLLLGTGVPPIPAYLLTVLIVAPLMVQSGTPVVAAHMFSLYYANMAFITPPIAVGAFVAAGLVGASFWRISIVALRLAVVGFVVPAVFVYRPELLLIGGPLGVTWAIAASAVIVICLAAAMEGWLLHRLAPWERVLLVLAGILLVPPLAPQNLAAVVIAAGVYVRHRSRLQAA